MHMIREEVTERPAFDPEGDGEILHQSDVTRVWRRHGTGAAASVICKEFSGPNALQRVRHERRILERLAHVEGVPRLVPGHDLPCCLVMEDSGAVPLAQSAPPGDIEVAALLELALQLTGILSALHRAGVAHRNLAPAHVLCSGPRRRAMLINFSLATTFAEERPGFVHHRQIAGELPYLAPEQTGRTGWPVDQRADLYALGATLYHLATGRLPFQQTDPLQLIHDILARVPAPPVQLNPQLPQLFSYMIMRLLEKEPDRRYQSAEGVGHDLARLAQRLSSEESRPFRLGERDFALKLSPPSRLIGRSREIAALTELFQAARNGRGGGVLVGGAPGVGKSALINELRAVVTAHRGFFVAGKFDQHRQDLECDAVRQALRALGSLLLAEPEQELSYLRQRLLDTLGSNAGLIAMLPEFTLLLSVPPAAAAGDPLKDKDRLIRGAIDVLRAVASPGRPLVLVLDDLQWAGPIPVSFIDALLSEGVPGLLLVGSFRDCEVEATHPLSPVVASWERTGAARTLLRLSNLPPADLGLLLEEMLRLKPGEAAKLAEAVAARTGGNPYDTVELVNALRRDGALVPTEGGWSWDAATIRRYVGSGDVVDLLADRIERLPAEARALLEIMACLGGKVEPGLLLCASGLSCAELEEHLAPSLEDGLLVMEQTRGALRFGHDRVQQAAHERLETLARRALHLALARRLAVLPELGVAAGEQYLCALDEITEPAERRLAAGLLRCAAAKTRLVNGALAERLLAAAMALLEGDDQTPAALLCAIGTQRHAALYSLGRLDEADGIYHQIEELSADPLALVDAACVQMSSLTNRQRPREALALGLGLLRRLGFVVPQAEDIEAQLKPGLERFYRWAGEDAQERDLQRPEISDPDVIAAAKLINRMMPPAFFSDQPMMTWLVLESQRLWEEHGPCPLLVAPLCHSGHVTVKFNDYRTGYQVMRRVLAVGSAHSHEAETAQGRFLYAAIAVPWLEPLEASVRQSHLAREGLFRAGDPQFACYTFFAAITVLLDGAPSLDRMASELEAGLAFAARTGNNYSNATLLGFRQLLRCLRGETGTLGSFTDACFAEAQQAIVEGNSIASCNLHINRAFAALLFGDDETLAHHAACAMPLMGSIEGMYATTRAHLLQALSLARQAERAAGEERASLLAGVDACRDWLSRRAADAPGNFLHLLRLVEGERARAAGDFRQALTFFDAALGAVQSRQGGWHGALIRERAGLFHLAHGLETMGRNLLCEARQQYGAWGASAKVRQLEQVHPFLRSSRSMAQVEGGRSSVSADTVDLLAVLRASQALSSETGLDRLRVQVVDLLGAMTGATAVSLVVRQEQTQQWGLLVSPRAGEQARPVPLEEAGRRNLLPVSVLRYAERTREPLLVEDGKGDDRFRHDPYLAQMEHCSLLAVPILNQGAPRAMLLLENRLSRGAFTADRLDAVTLIAGQLAVSLENALLYEKLEERVQERTLELQEAQHELVTAARQAGMAEIATNVLHNVGNVLNSVNVSAGLVAGKMRESRAPGLLRAVALMKEHALDLGEYLSLDEKGKLLPDYLEKLALALAQEQQEMVAELSQLTRSVDHIKDIVATQQSYAGTASITEPVQVRDLVEDALRMNLGALTRHEVTVVKEFDEVAVLLLDKARVLQILVNLINNAKQAMDGMSWGDRRLTLSVQTVEGRRLRIRVKDEGMGISPENLDRIFTHGFTTRRDGHGFGLHSCALAAKEMGGTLSAESAGAGKGASFTLEIPIETAGGTR